MSISPLSSFVLYKLYFHFILVNFFTPKCLATSLNEIYQNENPSFKFGNAFLLFWYRLLLKGGVGDLVVFGERSRRMKYTLVGILRDARCSRSILLLGRLTCVPATQSYLSLFPPAFSPLSCKRGISWRPPPPDGACVWMAIPAVWNCPHWTFKHAPWTINWSVKTRVQVWY